MFTAVKVTLMVNDVERSVKFYTDVLGLRQTVRYGNERVESPSLGRANLGGSMADEGPRKMRPAPAGLGKTYLTSWPSRRSRPIGRVRP